MEHRPLGRTGVSVSKMCLGAMMFGSWGNPDHDDSIRIIHAALDAGINFVDTADVYCAGESEEIVGKALKGRRDDVVLATKFFSPMGEDPNRRGGSRRWIIQAVEDSLRRLAPTRSTSTRSTAPTRTPTSRRRSARSPTSSTRARSATSARSTFPASRIVEAQWVARERAWSASSQRSRLLDPRTGGERAVASYRRRATGSSGNEHLVGRRRRRTGSA